jgi:ABC-type phosphate/phosphonate transport system substrate-binding protein
VRNYALADWALPADVKISQNAQVLSALRRAAAGEPVTVLLDGTQASSLASLPFANDLQSIRQSAPLPAAILVVVDARLPQARAEALRAALLSLSHSASGADALASLHLRGFVLPQLPSRALTP